MSGNNENENKTSSFQPANTIFQNNLKPNDASNIRLSGGIHIPHTYYLGSNNTIPFVSFMTPTGQKELSWGELITLYPGQNAAIRNVSYMPGDLQIQSGNLPVPAPRITIPVEVNSAVTPAGTADLPLGNYLSVEPIFPCDTRRAKRAYISYELLENESVLPLDLIVTVKGYTQQHTKSPQSKTTEAYDKLYDFVDSRPSMIPLGSQFNDSVMCLVDIVRVTLSIRFMDGYDGAEWLPLHAPIFRNLFYVLEY